MKGTAIIDWFTFSIKGADDPDQVIREYLQMDTALFQEGKCGGLGYLRSKVFHDIRVFFEPGQGRVGDMGICVSMSGKGCRAFEAHTHYQDNSTPFLALAEKLHTDPAVNVSRVDLAVDDRERILDLDVIEYAVFHGQVNSRIRKRCVMATLDGDNDDGRSIYIGAPQSAFRVRIYDKAKEQYTRKQVEFNQHWVRFEIVMKGDCANSFLGCMVNTTNLGLVASGILNDKLSFIERDDTNITRCSLCQWWVDFLESLEKIELVSKEFVQHELMDKVEWIRHQVAPTLSLINDARGYFQIREFLMIGAEKRTTQQQALLEDYRNAYHICTN